MKLLCTLAFLSFACFMSCGEESEEVIDLEIRVKNISSVDFTDIKIITSEDHDYGDLTSGEVSSYQVHEQAYSYCYVKLAIESDTFIIQPIDFIGEMPLEKAKYTYEINATDPSNSTNEFDRLTITATKD